MRVDGLRTYRANLPVKSDKGVILPSDPIVVTAVPVPNVNRKKHYGLID